MRDLMKFLRWCSRTFHMTLFFERSCSMCWHRGGVAHPSFLEPSACKVRLVRRRRGLCSGCHTSYVVQQARGLSSVIADKILVQGNNARSILIHIARVSFSEGCVYRNLRK